MKTNKQKQYSIYLYDFHFDFLKEHEQEIKANPALNIDLIAYILYLIFRRYNGIGNVKQLEKARKHNIINIYSQVIRGLSRKYPASINYLENHSQIIKTEPFSRERKNATGFGLPTTLIDWKNNNGCQYYITDASLTKKLLNANLLFKNKSLIQTALVEPQTEANTIIQESHFFTNEEFDLMSSMNKSFMSNLKINMDESELRTKLEFYAKISQQTNISNHVNLRLDELNQMQNHDLVCTQDKYGRIYDNGLKSLPKYFRTFFVYKNKKKYDLTEFDLANAHPTFTFILLNRIYNYLIDTTEGTKEFLPVNFSLRNIGNKDSFLSNLLYKNSTLSVNYYVAESELHKELKKELEILLNLSIDGAFYEYFIAKEKVEPKSFHYPTFLGKTPPKKYQNKAKSKRSFMLMLNNSKKDWEKRNCWEVFNQHFPLTTIFWKGIMKHYHSNYSRFGSETTRLEGQIRIALFIAISGISNKDKKFRIYDMHDGFVCLKKNEEQLQWHFKNVTKKLFRDLECKLNLIEKPINNIQKQYNFYEKIHPIVEDLQTISNCNFYYKKPLTNEKVNFQSLLQIDKLKGAERKSIKEFILEDDYMLKVFTKEEFIPNKNFHKDGIPFWRQLNYRQNSFLVSLLLKDLGKDPLTFNEYIESFLKQSLGDIRDLNKQKLPPNRTLVRTAIINDGNYTDVLIEKVEREWIPIP